VAWRRWEELSWADLEEVAAGAVGLVPVGAVQHHGSHLPVGTDTIVARAVCTAASERCGAPVLPAIELGCGEEPGALSLAPAQLTGLARRWAAEAVRCGVRRLLFVNAHPGNAAALADAVDPGGELAPGARVGVAQWWALDAVVASEVGDAPAIHGSRAETALLLAIAPELVRLDRLAPRDPLATATEALGLTLLERTADGLASWVEHERAGASTVDMPSAAVLAPSYELAEERAGQTSGQNERRRTASACTGRTSRE
jgi:creatinine amidohydrolase